MQNRPDGLDRRPLFEDAGARAKVVEMSGETLLDSRPAELRDQSGEGVAGEDPLDGGDASER